MTQTITQQVKLQMTRLLQRIRNNWHNAVLFAILFAVLGQAIPSIYFRYFDKKDYYRINSATIVEEEVKQCEDVNVVFVREADITIQAKAVVEVVLVRADGVEYEAIRYARDLSIDKGKVSVISTYMLPCTIPTGVYFVRGTVGYSVKGGEHLYAWQTSDAVTVTANKSIKK